MGEQLGGVSLDLTSLPLVSLLRVSFLRASVSSPTLCSLSCFWSSYGSTLASKCQPDISRDTWAMHSHCAELLGRVGREWARLLLGLGLCRVLFFPALGCRLCLLTLPWPQVAPLPY